MIRKKEAKFPSELRSGPLSEDWVLIATGRARRPETFKGSRKKDYIPPKKSCPFCNIKSENPNLVSVKGQIVKNKGVPKNWTVLVVPNKYPALIPSPTLKERVEGLYRIKEGVGYHEVVITRDHQKQMGRFSKDEIREVIDVYQRRYLDLKEKPFVKYVSIFHNHGPEAGASIFHPHSQIMATPVIDPDLNKAVINARNYFRTHRKCIYCLMNEWEKEKGERVVFENREFLVVCPFISKAAFQMIISPKKHLSRFEEIKEKEKEYLAEAFQAALGKLYRGLRNPSYNFYLHTAPCVDKNCESYHWHWTIIPKTAIWAGFELCTGIEISTIEPRQAAGYLRKQ